MGGDIAIANQRAVGGEEVGDIRVKASHLKGVTVPGARAPSMIDEYPVLAIAAAFAEGDTLMEGIGEMRVKESDRVAAVLAGLRANGIAAETRGVCSCMAWQGQWRRTVATQSDHRIAMSFLVLAAEKSVTIKRRRSRRASEFEPDDQTRRDFAELTRAESRMIIAIDGPAAAGTSRAPAAHYASLSDTGLPYRAVGRR
jgi:5-enolpyruvylshikimate-3-phosphate synthase